MMMERILDAYARATAKEWSHDRSQTVGASEVGQCSRKVYWLKMEGDPTYGVARNPEHIDTWGARMRGTIMENHFVEPALRAAFGDRLLFAGAGQRTFVSGFLSATPDGLITELHDGEHETLPAGTCAMVEIKTIDPRTNLTRAKEENAFQTQVQMGLVRELTQYRPTHSILSYSDASFWNEVRQFAITFDEQIYRTAKERAAMIMTATDATELKPEGWIAGGRECDYCPFSKACGVARTSLPHAEAPSIDPQFAAEISDMAREIVALEATQEATEAELRERKDALKSRLREKGIRKVPGVLTWSHVKGRTSYDNKAIQQAAVAAGIDIENLKVTGDPSDRLTISLSAERETTQAVA